MKLSCDLCGGQLMVGSGGQSASCTVCGLLYSMERLREKVGIASVPVVEPPVVTPPVKTPVKVKITKKVSAPSAAPAEKVEIPVAMDNPILVETPIVEEISPAEEVHLAEEPPVNEAIPAKEDPTGSEDVFPEFIDEPAIFVEDPVPEEPPVEEPPVENPPAEEPPLPYGIPAPRIPASYWIPPMDPPLAPLFAMELRTVSFSTIRGTVLSGTVVRGSQLLLGDSLCAVISCKPAQPMPGTYAELTVSNCPSRAALRNLTTVIGYSPLLGELDSNALSYPGSPKAYMTRVLQAAFSDYQIQVTNAPSPKDPVTFTFFQHGSKRLVVILCHGNRYQSIPVLEILEQCQQQHIPALRFFENFWNNREYIIGRIRKALCS